MTGTMHVADHQGDTTHTWDTADPRTVQEIEEMIYHLTVYGGFPTAVQAAHAARDELMAQGAIA